MLILTRRKGEAIMIGDDVTVSVLAVEGSQVRIGIQAPKAVEVHRDEIYKRIHGENPRSQAASMTPAQQSKLRAAGDPIVHDIV